MKKITNISICIAVGVFMATSSVFGESNAFHKKILVEEFTGEGCVNCPRVASYIHTSLQKEEYADDVIVVCHHSGYHEDWLTTDFDLDYEWFYNSESTFAPAMMIDRYAGEGSSPVRSISSPTMMEELWNDALAEEAPLSVKISAEHDKENKKVRIKVYGDIDISYVLANPVITIFLVEDDIEAIFQRGAGADYIHQHVGRAVNNSWGDELNISNGLYNYDCEIDISPMWDTNNMYVVASVSNYNADDPSDCKVVNTSSLRFNDFTGLETGSKALQFETGQIDVEYYDLTGKKCQNNLSSGTYIKISKDKSGIKKVEKILVTGQNFSRGFDGI